MSQDHWYVGKVINKILLDTKKTYHNKKFPSWGERLLNFYQTVLKNEHYWITNSTSNW